MGLSFRAGLVGLSLALSLVACGGSSPTGGAVDGAKLAVSVAALSLDGVADVVWDIEVVNGAASPEVVWQRRVSSSGYGDGRGSASYVGPCDAGDGVAENVVRVWVVGVYSDAITSLGAFASGASNGAAGPEVPFQNPTTPVTPLTQTVTCAPNADRAVRFDVTLLRPAEQGFFDVAVDFNDIFCSAKFDCCVENEAGTACDHDIALLSDGGGQRGATMVLGFACTAGPRADVETELYLDALELDCTAPTTFGAGFSPDIVIDPSGPAGNQCAAGATEGCAPRVSSPGVDADGYLYQVGVYRGLEQLESGAAPAQKAYWNVALGVVRGESGGAGIEDCWLRTRGTADDAKKAASVENGVIGAGTVYPYLQWEVKLGSCMAEPLAFGSPTAPVRTAYTGTASGATAFAYGFGPNRPAGSFCGAPCEHGTCAGGECLCDTGYEG
ncbi:MAG: hypothetical protein KC635_13755, partial [Myxococcales bacterium]|nr:hypothetical protein [Myxococcales bacterium]